MTFDPTKPVQTRDGRKVELITTKGRGSQPLIGYIGESAYVDAWSVNGAFALKSNHKSDNDLINTPQETEVWVNVFKHEHGNLYINSAHHSRHEADHRDISERVACLRIKLVEGQFDD